MKQEKGRSAVILDISKYMRKNVWLSLELKRSANLTKTNQKQ